MTAHASLRIADDLALPLEAVTEPLGILAARRAGKSNAAVVMAEQMFDAGLHWVAIDPKGDWWGIRADADGKKDGGLPVPIFGGAHADVPLEPGAGALIADLVVDERLTAVLDVSGFASEAEKIRFLLAFGDRLFRRKEQAQEPTHIFFEEADDYAPQRPFAEQARLVHVMSRILKQGGARGLGGTVISQRSAVVHKDLLSQVQTMFALRTTGPQDRKAIRDWVSFSGENPQIVEDLPGLADGEAWVWSPNWLRTTQRLRFHRRRTFDSGATPKVGASKRPPATLADVDLGALTERMAATIEKAEASDPKKLQARIRELERELTRTASVQAEPERVVERVEVPVLNGQVDDLRDVVQSLVGFGDRIADIGVSIVEAIKRAQSDPAGGREKQAPRGVPARPAGDRAQTAVATPASRPVPAPAPMESGRALGRAERSLLNVLAAFPREGRTKVQLSILSGYSIKSSSFANAIGALRSASLVDRGRPDEPIRITEAGLEAAGDVQPVPSGPALLDHWRGQLGKAERALLDVLVDAYPAELAREELSERSGYSLTSSSFANAIGRLRSLQLVQGLRASEDLF